MWGRHQFAPHAGAADNIMGSQAPPFVTCFTPGKDYAAFIGDVALSMLYLVGMVSYSFQSVLFSRLRFDFGWFLCSSGQEEFSVTGRSRRNKDENQRGMATVCSIECSTDN